MKIVSIANNKGGTAKTTSSVALAGAMGARGWRVLLLDLDPQTNATTWAGDFNTEDRAFAEVLCGEGSLLDLVKPSNMPGVDVVPGTEYLGAMHKLLAEEFAAEKCLASALEPYDWSEYDICLIDTQPLMGLLTFAAFACSDFVLAPVEASPMAVAGLAGMLERVEKIRKAYNEKLEFLGVLACRVNDRTLLSREIVERLNADYPGKMFEVGIREGVRVREAWAWQKPLLEYDPTGNATLDYQTAAIEFESRLGLQKKEVSL